MKLISIIGPTAVGKTKLAANLAAELNGEVISADSRQIYKELNIGSGKDLQEYRIGKKQIEVHLIDQLQIGEEYNVFQFQKDFFRAYNKIMLNEKQAILCGGTGLYLEAALAKEKMLAVPEDAEFRKVSRQMSHETLKNELLQLNSKLHNTTDLTDRDRTIRAIEIERQKKNHPDQSSKSPIMEHSIFGIFMERAKLRDQIKKRLDLRLKQGMIEEVEGLLESGTSTEQLKWFGLEYKFLAAYLSGEMEYAEMYEKLLQAIRRFAKKQMSWFRRMEKKGHQIQWIDAEINLDQKINIIKSSI